MSPLGTSSSKLLLKEVSAPGSERLTVAQTPLLHVRKRDEEINQPGPTTCNAANTTPTRSAVTSAVSSASTRTTIASGTRCRSQVSCRFA